jgi:hypothetical protein
MRSKANALNRRWAEAGRVLQRPLTGEEEGVECASGHGREALGAQRRRDGRTHDRLEVACAELAP